MSPHWVRALAELLIEEFKVDKAVSIYITNDLKIKDLNRSFRNIDSPTDVLSFELSDEHYLGEIVISYQTAKKSAANDGHSLRKEIKKLIAHGFIHLLGLDHEVPSQRDEFFSLEKRALEVLCFDLGSIESRFCNFARKRVHASDIP
ncbi:MAG: rRNA maturation RNase YbeY [Aquificaceae bacterium]|nr:rRNA maturation RNase YbeY [Aquificaceae bacterium]MDW8237671.1 rRNA maturation RNase YbeY [Aquificaceae bacterium]